jgi:bisphosphoglycerate-independent phosphoglycerate mutase (AlkP superfamily)
VLFVGYGETDEWAHSRRYDQTLRSAHAVDGYIAELWRTMQSMRQYRDRTTFIITTDHGRGSTPEDWTDHGRDVSGAGNVWIAILGPDTPPSPREAQARPVTQSQIAATVAALLGEDYRAAVPEAAPALFASPAQGAERR